MARKRNRQTRPSSIKRYFKETDYHSQVMIQRVRYEEYFNHYYTWLQQIAYQLYDWYGLPDSIPENYLEISLIDKGSIGFHSNQKYGDILVNGVSTQVGSYNYPTAFQSSDIFYKDVSFPIYYYGRYELPNSGFLIRNKMIANSSLSPSPVLSMTSQLKLYATRLAFIKVISDINLNTQKTPYFITYDDDLILEEVQKLFENVDGNQPVIWTKALINEKGKKEFNGQLKDMISVLDLKSPYLVDKLETQKQKEWDEAMSCFGLMNISQYKKERMTKSESEANVQQVVAMQNSLLKPRKEFCHLYNTFYKKEISIGLRQEISVEPFTQQVDTEGGSYQNINEVEE